MSDSINGFPVIATFPAKARGSDRPGSHIIVDRGPEYEERYVVAWQGDGLDWWGVSCYYYSLAEARDEFIKRVEREVL